VLYYKPLYRARKRLFFMPGGGRVPWPRALAELDAPLSGARPGHAGVGGALLIAQLHWSRRVALCVCVPGLKWPRAGVVGEASRARRLVHGPSGALALACVIVCVLARRSCFLCQA